MSTILYYFLFSVHFFSIHPEWYDSFSDAQNNYVVDAKGNGCVLVAAAYSGDRLIGTAAKEMSKESGALKLNDALPVSLSEIAPGEAVSEIKLLLWNSFGGMMPLTDAAIISYVGE